MSPLVVVIGASTLWRADCVLTHRVEESCKVEEKRLQFADEDAWRMAYLWSQSVPPDRLLVFTEPDINVAEWLLPDGRRMEDAISGPATFQNILSKVQIATQYDTEPTEVIIYIAGHGTSGLHLEDGVTSPSMLLEGIKEKSGGDISLLLADVCDWGRMPRGQEEINSRIGRSDFVEISALSGTAESLLLQGGYFTLLMATALAGGADQDGDGLIVSGDLERFIYAYSSTVPVSFSPQILAPKGSPQADVYTFHTSSALVLEAEQPTRYIISLEQQEKEVFLMDILVEKDSLLSLPPNRYHIWRIPYEQQGHDYRLGDVSKGEVCEREIHENETLIIEGPCQEISLGTRGEGAPSWVLNGFLEALSPPTASITSNYLYHANQYILMPEIQISNPFFGRDEPLLGVDVDMEMPLSSDKKRDHLIFTLEFKQELQIKTSLQMGGLQMGGGYSLWASPTSRLDIRLQTGIAAVRLSALRGDIREYGWLSAEKSDLGLAWIGAIGAHTLMCIESAWTPMLIIEKHENYQFQMDLKRWEVSIGMGGRL